MALARARRYEIVWPYCSLIPNRGVDLVNVQTFCKAEIGCPEGDALKIGLPEVGALKVRLPHICCYQLTIL